MDAAPRHHFVEHTADVKLHVEADRLDALFSQAARGLAELQVEPLPPLPATGDALRVDVDVRAPDRAALLVEWLNEIVFQGETHRAVFPAASVRALDDTSLSARLTGVAVEELRTAVKAATLHGARVEQERGRWIAEVILDV